jgi:protein phosphatase PTC7
VGIALSPHPAKRDKGGEDAATITENFIALADGVGGWAESGIDPARYSRQLCKNINALIMYDGGAKYMCNPKLLCVEAAQLATETGSSTCVIASLDKEAPILYTSNLGDSGYILMRVADGKDVISVFRSKEQTHGFNFPFQIGTSGDDPNRAATQIHNVEHNDIIVVGTDGLFDNVYDETLLELVKPFVSGNSNDVEDITKVADVIAEKAEKLAADQEYLSPFAKGAREQFYDYMGGK